MVTLIWEDGHEKQYPCHACIKGVKHEGKRPIKALIEHWCIDRDIVINVTFLLHPVNWGIEYKYFDDYKESHGHI